MKQILIASENSKEADTFCTIVRFYTHAVVYTAYSRNQVIELLDKFNLDIVILDTSIPHNNELDSFLMIRDYSRYYTEIVREKIGKKLAEIFKIKGYKYSLSTKPLSITHLLRSIKELHQNEFILLY